MCSGRIATERVVMLLMHLHRRIERIGMERKDVDGLGETINFLLNQQRIADNLGLSQAHTNNTIRKRYKLGCMTWLAGNCGCAIQRLWYDLPTITTADQKKCHCCRWWLTLKSPQR